MSKNLTVPHLKVSKKNRKLAELLKFISKFADTIDANEWNEIDKLAKKVLNGDSKLIPILLCNLQALGIDWDRRATDFIVALKTFIQPLEDVTPVAVTGQDTVEAWPYIYEGSTKILELLQKNGSISKKLFRNICKNDEVTTFFTLNELASRGLVASCRNGNSGAIVKLISDSSTLAEYHQTSHILDKNRFNTFSKIERKIVQFKYSKIIRKPTIQAFEILYSPFKPCWIKRVGDLQLHDYFERYKLMTHEGGTIVDMTEHPPKSVCIVGKITRPFTDPDYEVIDKQMFIFNL